ncbi:site-specific integrase [Streptomyces sp. NBC_00249]|uniref:site-specific integrase n=1 Tax=Streptomyces sp. NBC_00249 TaxID=2975690 RepID=UPI0022521EB0|nr:site-specific integrase [Streptomyces sp. NBC_00249]MCX5194385.1 site-specific integrase [Streptomyces sp. NBC_00249]
MTLVNAVRYAIELGQLRADPLANISWRITETVQQVDPRVVVNPVQARNLLCAVSYVGGYGRARGRRLVGLFAGMYYGGLRPVEAVAVTLPDCELPTEGWGSVIFHATRPSVGKKWTDSGRNHDLRGLKSRPPGGTRTVPLPHELVSLWRESVDTFGTGRRSAVLQREGRHRGIHHLRPCLARGPRTRAFAGPGGIPLAARPYDLRHSALSTWLNAGVDPTEVAERAGNSVEVLMTRYAKCLYGRQALADKRIDALLDEYN